MKRIWNRWGMWQIDDMGIFKSFTLNWWQAGLFKLSVISLGIIIGSTWANIFKARRPFLLLTSALPGLYLLSVWWKQ